MCDTPPSAYQWRYQAGLRGHVSPWRDVVEEGGLVVGYGTNRITAVEFRVKPEREVCESFLRTLSSSGWENHQCVRDIGHPTDQSHMTSLGDYVAHWFTAPEHATQTPR